MVSHLASSHTQTIALTHTPSRLKAYISLVLPQEKWGEQSLVTEDRYTRCRGRRSGRSNGQVMRIEYSKIDCEN